MRRYILRAIIVLSGWMAAWALDAAMIAYASR